MKINTAPPFDCIIIAKSTAARSHTRCWMCAVCLFACVYTWRRTTEKWNKMCGNYETCRSRIRAPRERERERERGTGGLEKSLIKLKLNLYRYRVPSSPLICIFHSPIPVHARTGKTLSWKFPTEKPVLSEPVSGTTTTTTQLNIARTLNNKHRAHSAKQFPSHLAATATDHRRPKVYCAATA